MNACALSGLYDCWCISIHRALPYGNALRPLASLIGIIKHSPWFQPREHNARRYNIASPWLKPRAIFENLTSVEMAKIISNSSKHYFPEPISSAIQDISSKPFQVYRCTKHNPFFFHGLLRLKNIKTHCHDQRIKDDVF